MAKKILYIVLAALFIFGLLFLLWSWLFSGTGNKAQTTVGSFGTASDTDQTVGTNIGTSGNGETTLGQGSAGQNSANGSINLGGNSTNGNAGSNTAGGGGGIGASSTLVTTGSAVSPPGVVWLGGGNDFTPSDINILSSDAGGFAPTITSNTGGSGSSGTTLIEALAATAIAGGLKCALPSAVAAISAAGTAASVGGSAAGTAAASATGVPVSDAATHALLFYISGQQTTQTARNAAGDSNKVVNCLVNVIGKVALQQITISVVNWINSGFSGQPSFVNNYQQFFTNVADLSAGEFIQGTGLAFLCSPFKLQIKIAIAQSYANRGAQSCSLTGIINNVTNFMNGSFNQGGWPGLLSFTTMPTNNPYGALAYAQVGLVTAQSTAAANAKNNISPTGFLNLQEVTGCDDPTQNGLNVGKGYGLNSQAAVSSGALGKNCKAKVVTPGGAIADSLTGVEKSTVDQLGIGNDIDQIISALTTQLITKTLQNGLSSLSQGTTQTAADLASQQQAASLLLAMQSQSGIAQQIGTIDQGSITDIQSAQSNLNGLADCWDAVASSTSPNASAGTQNAASARATLQTLQTQINGFNNDITQQNTTIATIDQFEAQVSSAQTDADVANATASYNAAVASGTFPSQADVTTAQQNRTTLQSQLANLNTSTQAGLQQCEASH